jgi:hypothetical protein
MADDESKGAGTSGTPEGEPFTILTIPEGQAPAVLEFIANMKREDADVGGHMMAGGMFGGISYASRASTEKTDTGCTKTITGKFWDMTCSDTDTITIN